MTITDSFCLLETYKPMDGSDCPGCRRIRVSMRPLSSQNVESELSYAYIHAIAAHANMACEVAGRHNDNVGVDAKITAWAPFPDGGYRDEVDIKVQLKATKKQPTIINGHFSYSLAGINQYDDLRSEAISTPRILVVLFLPEDAGEWLSHSNDALLLRRCAYWVSLRGAPASENKTSQTIYIPQSQVFNGAGLSKLASDISRTEIPLYQEPSAI